MKISAKIDYACKALLELSLHWPNNMPLQINEIAQSQQIPLKFLTQIMLHLKQFGFVQSLRGKKGGYLLTKSPQKIRLSDVMESLGGSGYSNSENRQSKNSEHIMDMMWKEIDNVVMQTMDEMNFEKICDRKRKQDRSLVFQI